MSKIIVKLFIKCVHFYKYNANFIAKKVKTKSLNEIEEEEKEEKEIKEDVEDTETNMDTEPVEEEFLTGTKEENALPGVLLAGGGVLVLAGLGAGIWYFRKRK